MLRVLAFLLLASPAAAGQPVLYKVDLEARTTAKADVLGDGVEWRVFRDGDTLVPAGSATGGRATLELPGGSYYLHAAYGQAGRTLRLEVTGATQRTVVLNTGGLMLDAKAGEAAIAPDLLRFDVYEHREREDGRRRLVAFDVAPERVVRLNAGTYHVLSRYGRHRTEVRADLVVRAGETTHATLLHRGAEVRLRLASAPGGIPIANTAWSVFSDQGEQIFSSAQNAPRLVLPEGDYEVVARNGERVLKRALTIEPGAAQDVELLLP